MTIDTICQDNLALAADAISALPPKSRHIIAIAGAPASGKSTFAEALCQYINDKALAEAALLPMDGYHYDDILLKQLGRYERKGAPDTFDVGGFRHTIERIIQNEEPDIIVPVFDRNIEIARAGARSVKQSADIIIVEGNYLLIDQEPWSNLYNLFDLTIFIDVPMDELKARLRQRWIEHNYDEAGILRKLNEVDGPNAEFIIQNSRKADLIIS